jgi:glycosyltransferase involved in cell wall biosynthesis
MRIAAFGRSLPVHALGGLEVHFQTLVEGLAVRGHEVEVFTTKRRDGIRGEQQGNLLIHYLPGTLPGRYEMGYFRHSAMAFLDRCRKNPFDVMLSESSAICGVLRRHRFLPAGIPAVWIAHGTWKGEIDTKRKVGLWRPKQLIGALLCLNHWRRDRKYIRLAEAVIACGKGLRDELVQVYDLDPERVVFQSNGVDTNLFAPDPLKRRQVRDILGLNQQHLIVMLSGRLHPEKGFGWFIEQVPSMIKEFPELRCIIVGEGPERQELEKRVSKLGLKDTIRFLGFRPRNDLPGLYNAADIFVFPSQRAEGQPISLIEAMASGLPVVANRVGWMASLFDSGVTGILVEPNNSEAFPNEVMSLLKDPPKRKSIGLAARNKAVEAYSIDRLVAEVESILQQLVSDAKYR